MEGRAAGKTVLFKGTADLGPKDGGVYDWIGRATEKEFVGFYTNAYLHRRLHTHAREIARRAVISGLSRSGSTHDGAP